MRILVVQESDWLEVGPHQSHHLMERLSAEGHEIRVVDHCIRWRQQKRFRFNRRRVTRSRNKVIAGADIEVVTPGFIGLPIFDYLSIFISHRREIRRQMADFEPDVIVGFGIMNASVALRFAKDAGIPFIYYIIDELHQLTPQKGFRGLARLIEGSNLRNADYVISINEALKEYCINLGAPVDKCVVLRAGVDLHRFEGGNRNKVRQRYGLGDSDFVLFFMGWLYKFSGIDVVARSIIEHEDAPLKLMVLGKGELWEELEAIRSKDGTGNRIILESWKPYEEIPDYLSASDVCILPAKANDVMRNIVPIKMYEYLAAGKPVIATRLHGLEMEFGKGNGVILVQDASDLCDIVLGLIRDGRLDEEGTKAKDFVRYSDWIAITSRFEEMLKEQISRKKSGSDNIIG